MCLRSIATVGKTSVMTSILNDYFVLQDSIGRLNGAASLEDLGQAFQQAISHFGFGYYTCWTHRPQPTVADGYIGLTNYPALWRDRYLSENYLFDDVFVKKAVTSLLPFDWHDDSLQNKIKPRQKMVLTECHDAGLVHGLTIPIHLSGALPASCSLSSGKNKYDPQAEHAVSILAMYFFHAGLKLLEVQAPTENVTRLAKRERECLEYAALGKTSWEMSKILGISERTAITHLENARRRLNAVNRTHAVAKALVQNRLSVPGLNEEIWPSLYGHA
jgi:LuxR family transcriptional regulator, quorum-sensing system regulator BjaR1